MRDIENLDSRILERMPFKGQVFSVPFASYIGSTSHGTTIPNSDPSSVDDLDYMGIIVPPIDYILGTKQFETWNPAMTDELDLTFYDIRKIVGMWAKGNPNTIGLLWTNPIHRICDDGTLWVFFKNKFMFSSKLPYKAYKGYARGQMDDMDKGVYRGYMGAKRKALVDQHGYDCKSAAHMIRLLSMAVEYFQSGNMIVDRTGIDAEKLKDIKTGMWSRDRVLVEADRLFQDLEDAYNQTILPDEPDYSAINDALIEYLYRYLEDYRSLPSNILTRNWIGV